MEVLQRRQITEVTTLRNVSHILNSFGNVYTRTQSVMTVMDYMDTDVTITKEKIRWCRHISSTSVEYLKKKEIKELELEEQFQEMKENDIDEYNGNHVNHFDEVNKS